MQHWENTAKVLKNLVKLLILVGRITEAYMTLQSTAVKITIDNTATEQVIYHVTLAEVLYRLGRLMESRKQFQLAETLQDSILIGSSGIDYTTVLLEMTGDEAAVEPLVLRGQTLLATATNRRDRLLAHLLLGQFLNMLQRFDESQFHLESAIAEVGQISDITLIPKVFLTSADFYRQRGDFERAQNDLERAVDIISCWRLQLYEVEACLLQGHLLLDKEHEEKFAYQGGKLPPHLVLLKLDTTLKEAEQAYRRADELIRTTNYRLKFAELSLLATRLAYHTRRPADALIHLQTARQFIDKLGCWHLLSFWQLVKIEIESPLL
jgi:tetratricopeptide (TPR) repeat protein